MTTKISGDTGIDVAQLRPADGDPVAMMIDALGGVAFPAMGQSLANTGYVKLPGGLIIQWGAGGYATDVNGVATVLLPTSFPNAMFSGSAVAGDAFSFAGRYMGLDSSGLSASSFAVRAYNADGTPISSAAASIIWIAIGY
jgi:hypothetical protein